MSSKKKKWWHNQCQNNSPTIIFVRANFQFVTEMQIQKKKTLIRYSPDGLHVDWLFYKYYGHQLKDTDKDKKTFMRRREMRKNREAGSEVTSRVNQCSLHPCLYIHCYVKPRWVIIKSRFNPFVFLGKSDNSNIRHELSIYRIATKAKSSFVKTSVQRPPTLRYNKENRQLPNIKTSPTLKLKINQKNQFTPLSDSGWWCSDALVL